MTPDPTQVQVRAACAADAPAIAALYNHHVLHTTITFEDTAVSGSDIEQRIAACAAHGLPWLIAHERESLLGYAYGGQWRTRAAYRFAAESTIYLTPQASGQGLGTRLYNALLAELRSRSLHCAIGGIALPNAASVALHEKLGFRQVAHFQQVGFKLGRWIDVGYWQLLL